MPDSLLLFRKYIVLSAILFVVTSITACGGDDPVEVAPNSSPALVITSGTFVVTATTGWDGCSSSESHSGTFQVDVSDGVFTMGELWTGDWDASKSFSFCETPHRSSTNSRGCTTTTWSELRIEFSDEDNFVASVGSIKRVLGDCSASCRTNWVLDGVRIPDEK